jgi:hypothetical protein
MAQDLNVAELCRRVAHSQGRARATAALFLNHASGAEAELALKTLLPVLRGFLAGTESDDDRLVSHSVTAVGYICEREAGELDAKLVEDSLALLIALADAPLSLAHPAMYRLGKLGPRGREALPALERIAVSERDPSDHPLISRRARAFEAIRLIDPTVAASTAMRPARADYLAALRGWQQQALSEGKDAKAEDLQRRIELLESAS